MSTTIEIEEIAKIRIQPNEYLMVRLPKDTSRDTAKYLDRYLKNSMKEHANRILIFVGDVQFDKVAFDEPQKPTFAGLTIG